MADVVVADIICGRYGTDPSGVPAHGALDVLMNMLSVAVPRPEWNTRF